MTDSTNRAINPRLLVFFLVVLAVLGGAAYAFFHSSRGESERIIDVNETEKLSAAYKSFLTLIDNNRSELADTLATKVANKTEFLQYLSQRNKDRLLVSAKPLMDGLRGSQRITHLYFIDPEGKVLLRVHKPEQSGDVLTRATYLQAKETHKVAAGIEMGKNFFSLRAIQPVEYEGKFVGYIEIGQEIDHMFDEFKDATHNEVALFLSDAFIKDVKADVKGAKVGGFTLLEATDKKLSADLAKQVDLAKGMNSFTTMAVKHENGDYLVGIGPFKDVSGKPAGVLVVQMDVSALPRGHKNRS